jgi:hypothetical protein
MAKKKSYPRTPPKDNGIYSWYALEIVKVLESTYSGHRLPVVFCDWLEVVECALTQMPIQAAHVAEHGVLPTAPEEEQELFRRLANRYEPHWERTHEVFSRALALLQEAVYAPTSGGGTDVWHAPYAAPLTYRDILGDIYMCAGVGDPRKGQYFTPENACMLMAKITMMDNDPHALVMKRLKEALLHPDNHWGSAVLIGSAAFAGEGSNPDDVERYMFDYVVPAAMPFYKPVGVCDPSCGSGRMLLAAASQFPWWAVEYGLVQFYGQDIDIDCVRMARINVMLYGLNGWGLRWKLAQAQLRHRLQAMHGQQGAAPAPEPGKRDAPAPELKPEYLEQMVLPLDEAITLKEEEGEHGQEAESRAALRTIKV